MSEVDPLLREKCVCPSCHGQLRWDQGHVECLACGRTYPIEDGVPVFVRLGAWDEHKRREADLSIAGTAAQWEVERPLGSRLYGWLMAEKFRRSIDAIANLLPGATGLVVCAGSGMDAEFLARSGTRVIASDISLEAIQRTRERARRHGVELITLVADVEALPFRDADIEVVYVHDGLHHLSNPEVGLREMARIASLAVSVSEPADAAVTSLAIRMGIALTEEEPMGTHVERLDPQRVAEVLREAGMDVETIKRYAMFYRHEPGPAMRLLSRPGMFGAARGAIVAFNALLGGDIGNKLSVQATRRNGRPPPRG